MLPFALPAVIMHFIPMDPAIDHPTQFDEWNQWIDTKFDALEGITPNFVLLLDPIGAEELVRSYTSRDSMLHLINDQLSCQNKCELKIKTLKRKIHVIWRRLLRANPEGGIAKRLGSPKEGIISE